VHAPLPETIVVAKELTVIRGEEDQGIVQNAERFEFVNQSSHLVIHEGEGRVVIGQGADPDIITAAAKAYLNALNRLVYLKKEPARPQSYVRP